MAIASTATLLPLDRFARIAGIHPCHFNQVTVPDIAPAATCSDPLLQFSWQNADRTGREEIAQMIKEVEDKLGDYLNFSVRPQYYTNRSIIVPRLGALANISPVNSAIKLGAGYFISGGQEQKVELALIAPITYTDSDSDGYFETATVVIGNVDTAGNVVTAWQDVSVYYPNRLADDAWEIRPVSVEVDTAAGTITCVFTREQVVLDPLLFGYSTNGVDGLIDANFLVEVDIYHHWLDASQTQGQLVVSTTGESNTAIILPQNTVLGWGQFQLATWDATLQAYVYDCDFVCGWPDQVNVWFKAGYPLDQYGNMAGIWERTITYMVLSMLDRPICQCASLANFTNYWSYDFSQNNAAVSNHLSNRKLDNPLGTSRAALYAWEQILRYRNPD